MPYDSIKELPDSVRNNLPEHAQEISCPPIIMPGGSTRTPQREEGSNRWKWWPTKWRGPR